MATYRTDSNDGGVTFYRGEAMDVSASGNPTVQLLGGGNIYGNIELQSDAATINVTGGETLFNRITPVCFDGAAMPPARQSGAERVRRRHAQHPRRRQFHLLIDAIDGPRTCS